MKTPLTRLLFLTLTGVLALGTCITPLLAQSPSETRWWSNPRVVEALGLSDAQQERIESIVYETESANIDLRASERKANLELARLLDQPEFEQDAIDAVIDRIVDAKCSLSRVELESRAAIAGVLSHEQRIKLMDFLDKVRERRTERRRIPRSRR